MANVRDFQKKAIGYGQGPKVGQRSWSRSHVQI